MHDVATSPSLSGAAWLSSRFKLRASASRAFRLPSYTDIYYSSPSTLGNTNLKPESATSYEGGLDAYLRSDLHAAVTVFQRRDSNVIDYVEPAGSAIFQAQNLPRLHFTGVEASMVYEPVRGQHVSVSFAALHGQFASPENIVTEYTFAYPVHDAVDRMARHDRKTHHRADAHRRGQSGRHAMPMRSGTLPRRTQPVASGLSCN